MTTRFDPCAYEEKMLEDLAGMQRVRLQEYGGLWWDIHVTSLLVRIERTVDALRLIAGTEDLRDIEVKCADIANYAAMISADAQRSA